MEAASKQRCRKRARDDDDDEAADNTEILQANKKQEYCSNNVDERRYEFHDGIGVFDFPWLKEGAIFSSASFEDHDQKFAPCSYLFQFLHEEDAAAADCSSPQNLTAVSLPAAAAAAVDGNHHHVDGGKSTNDNDEESLWSSLAVDDLEPLDCIWSCVIDHPLDVGFNKG